MKAMFAGIAVLGVVITMSYLAASSSNASAGSATGTDQSTTSKAQSTAPAVAKPPASQPASAPTRVPASQPAPPRVVIDTNFGPITVELDPQRAPLTVENFLAYVDARFYDNTIFHRVIHNFMIQGGGFDADLNPKMPLHPPLRNESRDTAENKRGTLAMARSDHPDSATCQFFINTVDNDRLNYPAYGGGYAVFGQVIDGMDVVDKIAAVRTSYSPISPQPTQPVENIIIRSVRRVQASSKPANDFSTRPE